MVGSSADTTTLMALSLATLLPFVSFLVILIFTRKRPELSAGISIGAITVSLLCSLALLGLHLKMAGPIQYSVRMLASSGFDIPFGFLLDQLSLLMLVIVAVI